MTDQNRTLCLNLMHAEAEEEIIRILRDAGVWDAPEAWSVFGGMQNNFSTIGNQQGEPIAALVEKLVNSTDARLVGECLAAGIDPADAELAPPTAADAIRQFFGRPLDEWTDSEMLDQARQINLTASGAVPADGYPSITISDAGEGQEPDRFAETFLSLNSANKVNIPFVQGKFNMGGTGALQFCGTQHNLQLIVSRRRPELLNAAASDRDLQWGFTIVRRRDPEGAMRSSVYEYLAPDGVISAFSGESLPIFPTERPEESDHPLPYGTDAPWGTLIKLYSYRIDGDRSAIIGRSGLVRRVEAMMPRAMLPVRFVDARYARHSGMTAFGVETRLEREREKVLEPNFPVSGSISVGGVSLKVSVYAFGPDRVKTYRPSARSAVVFLVNGQTHASFGTAFFRRNNVRKSYIANDLFVSVDCTPLEGRAREDLFLNSRDRMREGDLKVAIEQELAEFLREQPALDSLNQARREALVSKKVSEQRGTSEQIATRLLNEDRELRKLLLEGGSIDSTSIITPEPQEFTGKKFPTFFDLTSPKERDGEATTSVAVGSRVLLEFQTDAENKYFSRKQEPGRWRVTELVTGEDVSHMFSDRGPSEGTWTCWSNSLSGQFEVGDEIVLRLEVDDDSPARLAPFSVDVHVQIKSRPSPPGNGTKKRRKQSGLKLPQVFPVWEQAAEGRSTWADMIEQGIPFDSSTVVEVRESGDPKSPGGFDIYLNMDNVNIVRRRRESVADVPLLDALWESAYILLTLSILRDHATHSQDEGAEGGYDDSAPEFVLRATRSIAPVIALMRDLLMAIDAAPTDEPE